MQKAFTFMSDSVPGCVVFCFGGGDAWFFFIYWSTEKPRASILPNVKKRLTALLIICLSQWLAAVGSCRVWPLHFCRWKLPCLLRVADDALCKVPYSPKPPGFSVSTWTGKFWCASSFTLKMFLFLRKRVQESLYERLPKLTESWSRTLNDFSRKE